METDQQQSLYANKVILAPMVRVGTLPMRLLALRFGCELVYSEEIIDFKLIKSRRVVNEELGTVDFIDEADGFVIFRTCAEEKERVVVQIGTNDPERAVRAAQKIENDVAAIDINMGCPKSFSLKGGMGAALLTRPDQIHRILTALKANIKKPVSCKIRVLPDLQATVELAKMIASTGVDALAVHGRTKDERPQHPNRVDYIRAISAAVSIPVIANGGSCSDINLYDDIAKFRAATGASSVMIARAAERNCSIFARDQPKMKDVYALIRMYLKLAIEFDNNAINTKYCIQAMLGSLQESEKGKQLLSSYDLEAISRIYDLHDYYLEVINKRNKLKKLQEAASPATTAAADHIELPVVFDKNIFESSVSLPKSILHRYITQNGFDVPTVQTYPVEKQFHSVLRFKEKNYSTPYLARSKRHAEQSAALVLLISLGLCNDAKVLEKCLATEQNPVDALRHTENGRTYLIKINK